MSDEISETIESEATSATKDVMVDGRRVVGRDMRELIEADKYLAGKDAAAGTGIGIKFFNTSPGGSVQ